MPRPKRHNADYFSHDADMRNDPKIKALRRKYSLQGYAIWNMLLEYLTDCDYFEFENSELNIELLAGDFDVEPNLLKDIMEYCIKIQLLVDEDGLIYSIKHKDRFEALLNKRNRNSSKKEFQTPKTKNKRVSDVQNTQSKVKESKGEKSKVNNTSSKDDDERQINVIDAETFLNLETCKSNYLQDEKIKKAVCSNKKNKISPDEIPKRLMEFNALLTERGVHTKTQIDYNSHFLSWHKKTKPLQSSESVKSKVSKYD